MSQQKKYLDPLSKINSLLVILSVWFLLAIFALWFFELWPKTKVGWICSLTVGPAIYLIFQITVEGFTELFKKIPLVDKIRTRVEYETKKKRLSIYRIFYLLIETLALLLIFGFIVFLLYKVFGEGPNTLADFFQHNFK